MTMKEFPTPYVIARKARSALILTQRYVRHDLPPQIDAFKGQVASRREAALSFVSAQLGRLNSLAGLPAAEHEIVLALQGYPSRNTVLRAAQDLKPLDAWHSWDATPWLHPWLTPQNLEAARAFDKCLLARLEERLAGTAPQGHRYAFAGNLANNMAMRALPLRGRGYNIDIVLHPLDKYVMSQPGWELSTSTLETGETNIDRLRAGGLTLPVISGVIEPTITNEIYGLHEMAFAARPEVWRETNSAGGTLRQLDAILWPSYLNYKPMFAALQAYDAVFAAQAAYIGYLSGRPYLTAQTGGDLWLEASRQDALGTLQRRSYAKSAAILATNPWAYAMARRFRFNHVIYAPLLVDTCRYCPGPPDARADWQARAGGDFFVLSTARVDSMWKGSETGLEGFCRFAASHPGARLVLIGWGEDQAKAEEQLAMRGLAGRTVLLPIAGKMKVIEYLRSADCLIDQFKIGYYGATALEAMACGLPVVMRLIKEQYDALCPTGAPPVLNCSTPEEVAAALVRLAGSEEYRRNVSALGHSWILQNHTAEVWGRTYGALLQAVALGIPLDFTQSPLNQRLSPRERAYHADQLAHAPPFPQYVI